MTRPTIVARNIKHRLDIFQLNAKAKLTSWVTQNEDKAKVQEPSKNKTDKADGTIFQQPTAKDSCNTWT